MVFKPVRFISVRGGSYIRFSKVTDKNACTANFSAHACVEYALKKGDHLEMQHDRSTQTFAFRIAPKGPSTAPLTKRSAATVGFAASALLELDKRLSNTGRIPLVKEKIDGADWITFTANDPAKAKRE